MHHVRRNTNIVLKSNCYETLYEAANKELVNIDKWLLANQPFLNTDKTHYVIFRTPKTKPPSKKLTISIRNKFISQQPKTKFLEIIFHEHLSWKLHMDFVLLSKKSQNTLTKKLCLYCTTP